MAGIRKAAMLIDKHRPILQLRNNARLAMNKFYLNTPIAQHIWETKYCFSIDGVALEWNIEDSWRRVANTLASVRGGFPSFNPYCAPVFP